MNKKQIGYLVLFGSSALIVYAYLRSKKPKSAKEQELQLLKDKYAAQSIQGNPSLLPDYNNPVNNPYVIMSTEQNPLTNITPNQVAQIVDATTKNLGLDQFSVVNVKIPDFTLNLPKTIKV